MSKPSFLFLMLSIPLVFCRYPVDPCSEPFACEAYFPCFVMAFDTLPILGPCMAYIPSWSYNQETGECEKFIYGGCGGNNNIFESKQECADTCETTVWDDLEQLCDRDNDVGKQNFQIVDKINHYRSEIGRSPLKCSGALVSTAKHHTRNQMDVNPSGGDCNLHSWLSSKHLGKGGKKCCYKSDHSNANCMWKKPVEILGWDGGNGYEISYASGGDAGPDDAFKGWRHSSAHNDVMASNGMWKSLTKVGCYYEGNYANCWFAD